MQVNGSFASSWKDAMPSPPRLLPTLMELLSFRGRTGRGDFFILLAFPLAAWAMTGFLIATGGWYGGSNPRNYASALALINLASPVLLAALTVRRLHDLDRPSWWAIPLLAAPLLALMAAAELWRLPDGQIAGGAAAGVFGYLAIVLFTLLGTAFLCLMSRKSSGPNRHGPQPTDPIWQAVVLMSGPAE